MTEKKKFVKQTSYLIQDLFASSSSVMPVPRSSGNHAWFSSDRARERKQRKWTKVKAFSTVAEEPTQTSSSWLTTSSLAKRSKTSSGNKNKSGSNHSTLSMISTPWSTESSATTALSHELFRGRAPAGRPARAFSATTSTTGSLEPPTTLTEGRSSSNGLSAFLSKESSQTDKERPEHVKFVHVEVPEDQRSPLGSTSLTPSWTLEAFNSTELFSERLKVQYPWSPDTNDQIDLSIEYPSSFTVVSQKCSWDTLKGRYAMKDYTPMNYIPNLADIHPNHDWTLVKKKGITLTSG